MTLITKEYFSSSIAGRGINIVATASPGSLIHKTTANAFDEVWLWASNPGSASVNLVIEFGGTNTSDLIVLDIPSNSGLMLVVPGIGLSAGQSLRAFADTPNAVDLFGYVNRISEAQQSPETPTSPSWIRPAEWLELPTVSPGDEKLVGLYRVNPDSNFFTFTGEGAYTIDFGDGSAPINYGSGTTAYKILDWDDYSGSTLTSDGFRQAVITITPQSGQHITSIDLSKTHNQPGLSDTYNNGWLDIDLSGEFIDNIILNSDLASLYHFGSLTRFNFIGVNAITDFSGMFNSCPSLSAIPTLDTSNGTDFFGMFAGCLSLSAIPTLDTSNGTNFSSMFAGCLSLSAIPTLDTSNGTNFSNMFNNCYSLQSVPALNTANGTNFSSMFNRCLSLSAIPTLDTSNGTDFSSMFNSCLSLSAIPTLDTSNGTNFSNMFAGCSSLSAIPTLDTSNGTNFSGMFNSCLSLSAIQSINPTQDWSVEGCLFSADALNIIYTALPTATATLIITGNWGAAASNTSIATAKGWTITN